VPYPGQVADRDPSPPPRPFGDDPPIARAVRRVDNLLGRAEQVTLVALGLFLVLVCVLWLLTEKLAARPLEHASADVRYTVYLIAMVGGAYAAHHRRLLSMDVISRALSRRVRSWLRVVTTVFALLVTGIFFWYALDLYLKVRGEDAAQHWMPAEAAQGAMALGGALIAFHLLAQLAIDLDYLLRGKVPPEPELGAA
jgi:TRAP-type C4-dicarboxylate transport system permease small subunit